MTGRWRPGLNVRAVDYEIGDVSGAGLIADGYTGHARMVVDEDRKVIVGVTFTGPGVGDLIHAATVAVVGEVPLDRLWHAVPSYPDGQRDLASPARDVRPVGGRCRASVADVVRGNRAHPAGLVVGERLRDLGMRVHHERSVVRHRLADRPAAEDEQVEVGMTALLVRAGGRGDHVAVAERGQLS